MKNADEITQKIEQMNITSTAAMREKILSDATQTMEQTIDASVNKPSVGRLIMNSKMTKLTAAAVIMIAVLAGVNLFNGTPVWAIEQSIQAHHSVRSIFVKSFQSRGNFGKGESADLWIKYDSGGRVSHFRMDAPHSADGAKTVVLRDGIAKVWMPDKNGLMLFRGGQMTKGLEELAANLDPKQTLQRLYDLQGQLDESEITIIQPQQDGDPVLFELMNNAENDYFKYYFDADTKLLIQFEKYRVAGENYELEEKFEFFRYNEFIDDSLFELEIPDDAFIIDQATEEVGIEKEAMTDDEVAMEVVRQCLESAIAQDYKEVKKMLGGIRGDALERAYGGRILRIVSIGKPVPHEEWKHILVVPCKIEVENKRTGRNWIADFRPHVKRLENQSGNKWSICGGI
ncbi:MAG: LolA family protein [Planctomycetota bacterium]|jgi:outer membrane lipoprotein-sorting protein